MALMVVYSSETKLKIELILRKTVQKYNKHLGRKLGAGHY